MCLKRPNPKCMYLSNCYIQKKKKELCTIVLMLSPSYYTFYLETTTVASFPM